MNFQTLNIFYQEPDSDRWFKYDRYLRKLIRRIIRGKPRPGGQMMVALNLLKGLDSLGIAYRFNDFKYAKKHPNELIGVIGKSQLIFENKLKNPVLFGASVFSHPLDCPNLFETYPNIKKILVPGEWMKNMFAEYYEKDKIISWPVGIDTDKWIPSVKQSNDLVDFLIYDKIRWEHDNYEQIIINPILEHLKQNGYSYYTVKYGSYKPNELISLINKAKSVIFLCEHETQGLAYQQILSTNTPVFAWDRGGFWQDPDYFPEKVKYKGNVSSVPYWSDQCGLKFKDLYEFKKILPQFLKMKNSKMFSPRKFILENLTLERCAEEYCTIIRNL